MLSLADTFTWETFFPVTAGKWKDDLSVKLTPKPTFRMVMYCKFINVRGGLMFAFLRQWELIFVVSSCLVNYLGTHELCLRIFMFVILKRSRNSPNKSLANINEFTVYFNTICKNISVIFLLCYLCSLTHIYVFLEFGSLSSHS